MKIKQFEMNLTGKATRSSNNGNVIALRFTKEVDKKLRKLAKTNRVPTARLVRQLVATAITSN